MPCYHPLGGFRSKTTNASGKRSITFNRSQGYVDMPVEIPCGQCIGCRLERSRQWAIRCMHEAKMHEYNSFITLTYAPEHLPKDKSLNVKHYQDFMKRLRQHAADPDSNLNNNLLTSGTGIRFFHCGEYGENFGRPHYHACLFNLDFKDRYYRKTVNGFPYYTSKTLQEIWPYGFSIIGDVTFESAAYVARYITKKITGKNAFNHYNQVNYETGEILQERRPEYTTMSRRPGIGKPWLEKYMTDVFPDDFVLLDRNGTKIKSKVPKFYNAQYELAYPSDYQNIKAQRKNDAKKHEENNTRDRLDVREYIQQRKMKLLKRNYENE